ncbi:hypothetical protein NZD89_05915 [Alicyclobacillus fastidiosus]|uniref:Uncharacterized protein n=1 Tax=Alicyclobacillus fastidiosus TaxID=392011 RepID=A0ABY6ZJ52_9BACL|nr:hypothetical protein [Alicyclobacillus fastidiosus]WAH42953.1 hypothetical protein NZD89_05915 [Alicyclobacillus fastidiosus]
MTDEDTSRCRLARAHAALDQCDVPCNLDGQMVHRSQAGENRWVPLPFSMLVSPERLAATAVARRTRDGPHDSHLGETSIRAGRQREAPTSGLTTRFEETVTVPDIKGHFEAVEEKAKFEVGDRVWIHSLKQMSVARDMCSVRCS